jgi:O-antigen biosynthesis protein
MALEDRNGRVRVDGKFFRLGDEKFHVKGVAYGPFALSDDKEHFPNTERTRADLHLIRELGANVIRIYYSPLRWLLDLANEHQLKFLIDIPWPKNRCFLDSAKMKEEAREAVRQTVHNCAAHPAVFGYSIVNEIAPDIVRWSGASAVENFIDELIAVAKDTDAGCLCTFANYPPTEFLHARSTDFVSFNVYLHQRKSFENYLYRLQTLAEDKPLVVTEFGVDSIREGESAKAEMLTWQIESAFRAGLAGTILFSFTDDWVVAGKPIDDWAMGLTTAKRERKASFRAVRGAFETAPYYPLIRWPKVSVVVACFNGARTLKSCLDSLCRLNYPDYEIILIDDGSLDASAQIASLYEKVRYYRQAHQGLSAARNAGIAATTGEIVAFTDADCRTDEDWLYYLVGDLLSSSFVGIGGPNFLPPEDSAVAAAVLVSPGGPAHVMLTDRIAEHIPGCNMAFYKWALEDIGGFDPIFQKAGDDVDVCWRLQQRGHQLGFSPAGFVWHFRRSTVRAYLKQQKGYGQAEALLVQKHPEYFNALGGSVWQGRIYSTAKIGLRVGRTIIYHGTFATGFFQTLYAARILKGIMFCTTVEYHALLTVPLLIFSAPFHFLFPLAITSLAVSLGVCVAAAAQAELPAGKRRAWSRPLIACLFFLQPIVRGWARYRTQLDLEPRSLSGEASASASGVADVPEQFYYWSQDDISRIQFIEWLIAALELEKWPHKPDTGWTDYDLEVFGNRWSRVQVTAAMEPLAGTNRIFRWRVCGYWSLAAKLAFWSVFGFEMLIVGFVAKEEPWLWMLLLTIPIFGLFLEQQKRNLQRLVGSLLDRVASQRQMKRLQPRDDGELAPAQ